MKLGFIGTGVIAEATVRGLLAADLPIDRILVTRRGRDVSARLAALSPLVEIAEDAATLAAACDIVVLSVRPQDARGVIEGLAVRADATILSLIATLPIATLRDWTGHGGEILRAIPLPSIATRDCVTAIHPPSDRIAPIFAATGGVISCETVEAFDAYAAASATMATYFTMMETVTAWLARRGTDEDAARRYLAALYQALAQRAVTSGETPAALRAGHSTPGGLNARAADKFEALGGPEALRGALDRVADLIASADLARD